MSIDNELRTDVELLKKDVSNIQGLLGRLDTAIDKIADATGGITKILAVHESEINVAQEDIAERKRLSEKETELLHKRISEMKDESALHHRVNHEAVMSKLEKMEEDIDRELKKVSERVTSLEKWKWYIMGASCVIGFVIASIADMGKFFN